MEVENNISKNNFVELKVGFHKGKKKAFFKHLNATNIILTHKYQLFVFVEIQSSDGKNIHAYQIYITTMREIIENQR
jgi:hypothetical protein